jgi:hypothetical protein
MSLPMPANVTFDVYRDGNAPPDDPDVAAAIGHLRAEFRTGLATGQGPSEIGQIYTHILLAHLAVDIRDAYDAGAFDVGEPADTIYIPDQSGTPFQVVFVERLERGAAFDHLRVYLNRRLPAWPTNQL